MRACHVRVLTNVHARRRLVCVSPVNRRSTSALDIRSISGRYINKAYLNSYRNQYRPTHTYFQLTGT